MCSMRAGIAVLVLGLLAACGGGESESSPAIAATFEPLDLATVHERNAYDIGIPAGWSVIDDGYRLEVGSHADLQRTEVLRGSLEAGQAFVIAGHTYNEVGGLRPFDEELDATWLGWDDLELIESSTAAMLGYPTEIRVTRGDDYARFDARVEFSDRTAFYLYGFTSPDEVDRFRPTFEAMIASLTLKGSLAQYG